LLAVRVIVAVQGKNLRVCGPNFQMAVTQLAGESDRDIDICCLALVSLILL